jgi:hypothetical protein
MRLTRFALSASALAAFMLAGLAVGEGQAPAPSTQKPVAPTPPPPMLHAQNLIMRPGEAMNNNRVFGSADQTGFYMIRNTFLANQTSRPHYHTMDRWVTVIKGIWSGGTGKVFQNHDMVHLGPGSVMYHPAYFIHYDGNQDGTETIVHIMGYGPVTTIQVEEDEKGNRISRLPEPGAAYVASPPPPGAKRPSPAK